MSILQPLPEHGVYTVFVNLGNTKLEVRSHETIVVYYQHQTYRFWNVVSYIVWWLPAGVALAFEEMHIPYTSGREICVQKVRNVYQWKEIGKRMPHFKCSFTTKFIKWFTLSFHILAYVPWSFPSCFAVCIASMILRTASFLSVIYPEICINVTAAAWELSQVYSNQPIETKRNGTGPATFVELKTPLVEVGDVYYAKSCADAVVSCQGAQLLLPETADGYLQATILVAKVMEHFIKCWNLLDD